MNALLTVSEFARLTGRDRTTIRRWMDEGTLDHVEFGGRRYIPSRVLTALTEAGAA
jgi:excisionase family DNA binding protein